jgi:hypothetical protein
MKNEPRRPVEPAVREEPLARDARLSNEAPPASVLDQQAALFHDEEMRGFRARWEAVQTGFVDEPRAAVEQADALVDEMMKRLTDLFTSERSTLEQQWGRGENVSTEDLRVALKRYRSFFERLLSV